MASKFIIKDQRIINEITNIIRTELQNIYGKQYRLNVQMPLAYLEVTAVLNEDWLEDKAFANFQIPIEWNRGFIS